MFNKVLILSASAGAGHVRAADALEKAFSQSGSAYEIRHIDVLNYSNKVFRHLYSKAYLDMVNRMPEVMGWLYDHLDKPWKNERRRLALDKLNAAARELVKGIRTVAKPEKLEINQSLRVDIRLAVGCAYRRGTSCMGP